MRPTIGLRLDVDTDRLAARLKGTSLSRVGCYFVSITGPGVTFDYGPLDLTDRNPGCMGFGRTSNLATLSDMRAGVRVRTVAGQKRLIRLLGASTSITDCTNRPIRDLFDRKTPFIYEIARAEVDAFTDKKIVLTQLNDLDAATDIVSPCDNTGGTNGGGAALVAASAQLAYTYEPPGDMTMRIFNIGSGFELTQAQPDIDVPDYNGYHYFLQPNGRDFYLFTEAGFRFPFSKRFQVGDGIINAPADWEQLMGSAGRELHFAAKSDYVYMPVDVTQFRQYQVNTEGQFTPHPARPSCPSNSTVMAVTKSFAFSFVNGGGYFYPVSPDGNLCPGGANGQFAGGHSGDPVKAVVASNGVIYVLSHEGNTSSIRAYRPSEQGTWSGSIGVSLLIPTATVTDIGVDPESRFLYVVAQAGDTGVSTYELMSDGEIGSGKMGFGGAGAPSSLSVDPLGRGVFLISATFLKAFALDRKLGTLTEVDLSGTAFPLGAARAVAAYPIYR